MRNSRIVALVGLMSVAIATSSSAQEMQSRYGRIVLQPGDKGRALLAALTFSTELTADSVTLASCSLARGVGVADFQSVLVPVLGVRLIGPPDTTLGRCSVDQIREHGKIRVYVSEFIQVRQEADHPLPDPARLSFIVRLQLLRGEDYREWHEAVVQPSDTRDAGAGTRNANAWRVLRYERVGWEWLHAGSYSSGPFR